jgi:hypothetical protein
MNDDSARRRPRLARVVPFDPNAGTLVLDPSDPMRSRAVVRHRTARREDLDGAASGAAVVAASSGITWCRREAARHGFDTFTSVVPPACSICGAVPCVNPSFCAACRVADQKAPWLVHRKPESSREISRIKVPDEHALTRLVRRIAAARPDERNKLTYWAACRVGEMVASGLLDAKFAAAIIAEAATRCGLSFSEAERTAWNGIRRTGGPHA